MSNIFKIFSRDFRKIFTNPMAIILAVGVAVLPSLYAWINIYANWDPYGSTQNMQVAVVISDTGYEYNDLKINVGDTIKENLKGNSAIDWQFLSKDEAIRGVEDGSYYAAIEIPSDFSESLTSIVTEDFEQPHIVYYANEKKNAIATKITDKVVQTVQTQVNESFVETVVGIISNMFGTAVEETHNTGTASFKQIKAQLVAAQKNVSSVKKVVKSLDKVLLICDNIGRTVGSKDINALLNNSKNTVGDVKSVIQATQESVGSIVGSVSAVTKSASTALDSGADTVELAGKISASKGVAALKEVSSTCKELRSSLLTVISALEDINATLPTPISSLNNAITELRGVVSKLDNIISSCESAIASNDIEHATSSIAKSMRSVAKTLTTVTNDYETNIAPKLRKTIKSTLSSLSGVSELLESVNSDLPELKTLSDSISESVKAGSTISGALVAMLDSCKAQLQALSEKLTALTNSDVINTVLNITDNASGEMGSFLACPVKIDTENVYKIETYGSAMAPFYSTLAVWVGGIILVAIFKTGVKRKGEISNRLTDNQEFFGRGLIFLAFAFVQSLIVCTGDLALLQIQCYHPFKFILAGAVGGLIFAFFIYSMVSALGDIGKAVAVILLVLQLGGSGGTFPIDVTPSLFRALNPYLPFTFIIEAMRECVCGTYGSDYWIDLLKLCAYIPVSLFFGIFLRRVLKNPIKFFSRKIEETDLM